MSAQQPVKRNRSVLPPITPAVRQRLQAVFEHAQRCEEKGDHDYAHDLYTQCLVDDPANVIYLQRFLENLAHKYGNNKKGAKFAAIKTASSRMAIAKAAGKGRWQEVFQAASVALRHNPWDTTTLLAVADAYEQIGSDECLLFILRWALEASPKNPVVNRRAALTLARLGQFDQAISCWQRVEHAKPGDEEAAKAISQLSVEKTIQKGGYNQNLLQGGPGNAAELEEALHDRNAKTSTGTVPATGAKDAAESHREEALVAAIAAQPAEIANYLKLAELFFGQERHREAEEILTRALAATGGGDLRVREQLEDAHLRRAHHQVVIAQSRAEREKTEEASDLARRMAVQANQAEMEVFAARSSRDPGNLLLKYELGLRCKRAGKYREAIQAFQAARDDMRHKALVQLHLGESFQHIRQFKLALSSYEAAIEATDAMQPDSKKLALYRAGVLAAELGERERAEKYLTELAAIDFGYRDVADRLDKLTSLRDSV
ncbi:MAG: hypothetical protein L0Z07_05985 [Planctomycetes bacterium]|nr:hypothetical protein [Planctomycetota bacterium]